MPKFNLLFSFIFLVSTSIFAAQNDLLQEKLDSLTSFKTTSYQEQVYIHADKPYYITGETIKFKVFCLERNTSRRSRLSKIAYVEILDEENVSHLQAKIELNQGTGYGEIYIPTNLITSNYIIRGYTRWMRNYGPSSFYHSLVTIVNPFKNLGLPQLVDNTDTFIQFTSEGGPLINGQKTKIVYEIKDKNGTPKNNNLLLFANDTLLISESYASKNGIGSFIFEPDIRNKYHAALIHEDSSITKHEFIPTEGKGLTLKVSKENDNYYIYVFCNDQTIANQSDELFFIVHQKDEIVASKLFSIKNGAYNQNLSAESINDGVFTVSLFGKDGALLRTRKVFNLSNSTAQHDIDTDKINYSSRERINIDLTSIQGWDKTKSADLSVSIGAHHDKFKENYLHLSEYLLLDNSLTSIPYRLQSYFQGDQNDISEAINDLLIIYAKHDTILWKGNFSKNYIPESRSHIITGMVKNKKTNKSQNGIMSFLSVPGTRVQFYANRSKKDGGLIFELKDFYGSNEIVVQNDYTKDSIYTIELDNPFSDQYIPIDLPPIDFTEDMKAWIIQQSQNMQVSNAYKKYMPKPPILSEVDTSSFFHDPDNRYYLDEYTRFVVMEEVMREYVTGVNVRKNKDGFHFMVVDLDRSMIYQNNPLILLDAVPIFDADDIIALDPLKIEKIETIKSRFHYGFLDCLGIVNYTSYDGDLAGYELNNNALVFEYDGVQWQKEYQYPNYSTTQNIRSKVPDYRNTIYWAPDVHISEAMNSNLEIYTSDYSSAYEIRIEGIDASGKIISVKKIINVGLTKNN